MSAIIRYSWLLLLVAAGCAPASRTPGTGASGEYLFCFWNTENFFDDKLNGWKNEPDKAFDRWFAENRPVFDQKVRNLAEVLVALNDGKGPDILALAEVEADSEAANILLNTLNTSIPSGTPPYKHVLVKNAHGGRNIVTAILTRLPVVDDRTKLIGTRHRILEGHITVDGRELVVLATHWTSRVSDEKGAGRDKYANEIYGRYRAMHKTNPNVSLLVCGDFNDNPDDASVREHLHATGNLDKVRANEEPPLLYDVFANLWAEHKSDGKIGSHYYRGKAFLFDHIVVSPGMLNDRGDWQYKTDTAEIVHHRFVVPRGRNKGHPLAFGNEHEKVLLSERGVSDHLPVTVRLTLGKTEPRP
jgi:endonuclease/exonuclease/phosphatase family metal-dependent hydrolase